MKLKLSIFVALFLFSNFLKAQSSATSLNFGDLVVADSSSTIIIPTVYEKLLTSNKFLIWNNIYSNIIFYNFKDDSSKKLFEEDTYITGFDKINNHSKRNNDVNNSITSKWIFYKIMNFDRNKNDKIDSDDPCILYVSDLNGNGLKSLTSSEENVISYEIYEKMKIAMVKIQRDLNKDGNFTSKDTDYYYLKLDLNTLTFGKKIEIK